MRRIVKGEEPDDVRHWKEENAQVPQNLTYDNMPKTAVKRQLLVEQGHLCAYTMQRIGTPDDCHIEHIVPRSQDPSLQISYSNLLACAPSNNPLHRAMLSKCPFGAEQKGRTEINDDNFVSPLQADVEQRFRYGPDGTVTHIGDDRAAQSTIAILHLNHAQLAELRKAAVEERVLDVDTPLSVEEALNLAASIMTADATGRLPEFCSAISHVATWYANALS